jgi:hypothetical protein
VRACIESVRLSASGSSDLWNVAVRALRLVFGYRRSDLWNVAVRALGLVLEYRRNQGVGRLLAVLVDVCL